jgi:spore coat polysaccharide biosynthesis protein SpsF (cytidylyltransferase family)
VVTTFLNSDPPPDFVTNRLPDDRTFPIGLDVEVCGIEALKQAWESATELYQREHVMPYLYEIPGRFDIEVIRNPVDHSHLRWTVDEQEDLELVRELYRELDQRQSFNWRDIVELIESQPALAELNATVAHKGLGE